MLLAKCLRVTNVDLTWTAGGTSLRKRRISRASVRLLGRVIRAIWLALGIAFAAILLLEVAYRTQAAVRAGLRGGTTAATSGGEFAGAASAAVRAEAAASAARLAWRPYVYYRRQPFSGSYVTVDGKGLRRTIASGSARPGSTRDVFVFGASPIWGTNLSDSNTIPSLLAAALSRRGIQDVVVTNYGEAGYTLSQEVIALMLELRAGKRPAVAVFYDGYNDVAAAIANGVAGATKDEASRRRDFGLGETLFSRPSDFGADGRALRTLTGIAVGRVQLLARFGSGSREQATISDSAVIEQVTRNYLESVRLVRALAREYGFAAVFAWMPLIDAGEKTLSAAEQEIVQSRSAPERRFESDFQRVRHRLVDSTSTLRDPRLVDVSRILAHDTTTDFEDDLGHTTIEASKRIAQHLAQILAPLLEQRL